MLDEEYSQPPDITKLNKNEISNTDWHKPKEGEKRERRTKQKREKRQEEKTLKKTTEELANLRQEINNSAEATTG